MKFLISALIVILSLTNLDGQANTLSLSEVIRLAQKNSLLSKKAENLQTTEYWQFKTYQSNYKPQVVVNGRLPGFSRASQEVTQPDGTIKFQSISQSNILGGLTLSQPVQATGGTIFVSSSLQRFDDLNQDVRSYNGVPIELGINQPFFRFNELKWDKKIEPLRYEESKQTYLVNMEEIAGDALDLFFYLLVAQVDYDIATINGANTDTLYQIADRKYEMGKLSRSDLIQLKLERLRSTQALAVAEQDLEIAELNLRLFLRQGQATSWELELPEQEVEIIIPKELAMQEAKINRPDMISFRRREQEAQRDLAEAKGTTGFDASLFASVGYNKNSPTIGEVYSDLLSQQMISLEFTLPIVDWGRGKGKIETAKANLQIEQNAIEQDQVNFEQSLLTELTLFRQYFQQMALNKEVDELSQLRYQIAQDRFVLGNLSITDLTLALREKDQARKDYITSLWGYWKSYYTIRELTLYDFNLNEKIKY